MEGHSGKPARNLAFPGPEWKWNLHLPGRVPMLESISTQPVGLRLRAVTFQFLAAVCIDFFQDNFITP